MKLFVKTNKKLLKKKLKENSINKELEN